MILSVTRADPVGNITLFVGGCVEKSEYTVIGAELMSAPGAEAEQVAFICSPIHGAEGRIELSGGEFCGNASRAYGMLLAKQNNLSRGVVPIEVSGCSEIVNTYVDVGAGTAYAQMPLPQEIVSIGLPQPFGETPLVKFEGIWHLLAIGITPDRKSFQIARDYIYSFARPEALGVLFLNADCSEMTPMVYVAGPGTIFTESSCGSGTAAVAAYLAHKQNCEELSLAQPAGTLVAHSKIKDGQLCSILMGGAVSVGATYQWEYNKSVT